MTHSRRDLLAIAGVAPMLVSVPAAAQDQGLSPVTPQQRIGPFYPEVLDGENMMDLTRIAGQSAPAKGRLVRVQGRVLDRSGAPVASAIVLLWQADTQGRYGHSRDGGLAAADPGFAGHAMLRTARDGGFVVNTIQPGAYADDRSASGLRTPHIHFEVIGEEGRLITEMYFPDEPLNQTDANIAEMRLAGADPALLTAARQGSIDADVMDLRWDVVLAAR